ncbi:MAG: 5'/3'-nucleotidase SurE [Bacteroidia bacterium]|nr:5'/3'-nucleotidase SurE [Bacteroidia bacterium]MCZ2277248.1 5'/3'-nucleotidase SurE [Bacteroidia bacterium]
MTKQRKKTKKVFGAPKDRPVILVTNDDGVTSPGLKALVEVMNELGEAVVVAPDSPQSGMGHAITIHSPLRLDRVDYHGDTLSYQCTGTPVDCVKLAVNKILNRKPDLLVSGINHGSNSSINVIYSGTMSAAMEGAIEGIPSIGFSLLNYKLDADMTTSKHVAKVIASNILKHKLPVNTLLNVNIPDLPPDQLKGIKVCRQALAKWKEEFDERLDPHGVEYYWLTGKFINNDKGMDTDEWALENGYVSVVPVEFDFTAYHAITYLNNMKWNV